MSLFQGARAAIGKPLPEGLSISPGEGKSVVRHPTRSGGIAESRHHQVFTDGGFVHDPIFGSSPIPRAEYEELIRGLNGQSVEISFFLASP